MAYFTREEIEHILQDYFDTEGKQQYVGARYITIFGRKGEDTMEWDDGAPYEPLTVVVNEGNSYVSRTYVPTGIDISDTRYWLKAFDFNAQVEQYRRETTEARAVADDAQAAADAAQADVDTLLPKADFSAENTVKNYVDTRTNDRAFSFSTVTDMQGYGHFEAGDIVHVNGSNVSNDGHAAWYLIKSEIPYPQVDVIQCGELFAQRITTDSLIGAGTRNDAESFEWMADCATSWMNVADQIRYDGAANLFFDDTHRIQGKWSMTCSIFAMAMAFGITYENSKYNGLSANVTNPLAYKDDYLLSLLNDTRGFYSDDILPYMIRKGYAFLPTEDFGNVQTGDILFYSYGIEEPGVNFLDVDHSAVFAFKNNDLIMSQWEVSSDVGPVQTTNFIATAYEKCKMVVRLPFQTSALNSSGNLFSMSNVNMTNVSQCRVPITKEIEQGKWYTFVAKCPNLPYGVYPGLYHNAYSHRLTTYNSTFDNPPYDDIYVMPFVSDIDISTGALYPSFVKRAEVTQDPIGTFEWVVLVEGFCPTLLNEIDYANLITDVSDSVSTTHTKRTDFKCYKCGRLVNLTIDIQLTSNVNAYATIATLPTFLQPMAQQFYTNFDITLSGNVRSIGAHTSGEYIDFSCTYLAKE